jgi:uncharacterized protein DUF955
MAMQSIGDKIFDYPKPELERLVDEFVRRRPFINDLPPVEIDLIVKRMKDVRQIKPAELLLDKHKTAAMVLAPRFMHRDLTVLVDQGIMDRRDPAEYNMALAEEIGHIELHRAVMLEIKDENDFVDLQRHARWNTAEHDAKYFGRALLMPRSMLEPLAAQVYRRLTSEYGFGDAFQFNRFFVVHLASIFEIPYADAQKRIDSYVGGLRSRIDLSFAARSTRLVSMQDEVAVLSRSTRRVTSGE